MTGYQFILVSKDWIERSDTRLEGAARLNLHGKLESTVRYLGIEVDDALEISEQIDL